MNMQECFRKGNYTYLRCYEIYFSSSYIIYFNSEKNEVSRFGNTVYIGIKHSKYYYINILFSPLTLLILYKKIRPKFCVTPDNVFSFWSALFFRWYETFFYFPICHVSDVIKSKTCHYLKNKYIENLFIKCSLFFSNRIVVVPSLINHDIFWHKSFLTKNKLIKVPLMVEEFPTLEFLQEASKTFQKPKMFENSNKTKFVTTSRLYWEKRVDEGIKTIKILKEKGLDVELYIFGDGEEKESLQKLTRELDIVENIKFMGFVSNQELVPYLKHCDAYFSIHTGTALREAIICECPILSYKNSMVECYFSQTGNLGFMCEENTPEELARGIVNYFNSPEMHFEIKKNVKAVAQNWNLDNLKKSLHQTFDPYL